jgi:hypothetical protein|tara:strand:+ start:2700 stop:3113 length:414 start_codon:yes stop_codon:yes gene_type:complete
MAFATNDDLTVYIQDIFDHGVSDWSDELALAETDVTNQIRIRYWDKFEDKAQFDKTKLVETQWKPATVYRALSAYILPKLSTFRLDDTFMEQTAFYKTQYAEEINTQFQLGIEYDSDGDGAITAAEITTMTQTRLYR